MRAQLLKKIIFIFFLLLCAACAYNQLIKESYYFRLSQNNRIKLVKLSAARGEIYDRKGKILAGRRLIFNAAVLPQETRNIEKSIKALSPILNISEQRLLRQFKRNFSAPFIPVVLACDIPKEKAVVLECRESDIPGLVVRTESLRDYRSRRSFSHILGYLGRLREEELKRVKTYGLGGIEDLVGRSGVEEAFDAYLRGERGGKQVEVDSRGHLVKVLGLREPLSGEKLYLTIDADLQRYVEGLLEEKKGVCIVMDVERGEILSMVSKPDFDPNMFITALNGNLKAGRQISELLTSKEAPLVNRAISGTYPPGSIFKIVVAAAALETGKITIDEKFNCPGCFKVGRREFFCWNLDGHGNEDIHSALCHSCNVFFYRLGLAVGPDKISSFARRFGLGSATGVDLPYESTGLVPSKSWKYKVKKEKWYDGETANFSIGQGYLLVTPLQITQLISAVANGGYLVRPHIVKRIGEEEAAVSRKKIGLKEETLEIIKEGMRRVIGDERGTGHRARIAGVEWAAKTGTAQALESRPAHGWFGAFYPFDEPRISVLVFLEYGGSGGDVPAVMAKQIVDFYAQLQ
ncbi:MAG: penicillin-binding protein 2 [Candidatus Omnitrophota bacterium]|nr:MAG: penicillin-binding protein 2 [Candidatus Omnitrophota bacterium]